MSHISVTLLQLPSIDGYSQPACLFLLQFSEFIIANVRLYALRNDSRLSTHAVAHFTRRELATALRKVRTCRDQVPHDCAWTLGSICTSAMEGDSNDVFTSPSYLFWPLELLKERGAAAEPLSDEPAGCWLR
jgi:hypothetical protein